MSIKINSKIYTDYLKTVYEKLQLEEDYVTSLDAATGDGDHWSNLNKGFSKLNEELTQLSGQSLFNLFKSIGMTMMSQIGGSSGVLYGGAYIAAAQELNDVEELDLSGLRDVLKAMLEDMMKRGKAERGWKTMIDALAPAVDALNAGLAENEEEAKILREFKDAAINGAEATKEMEAVRGRATYQANKGKGCLDPGAYTMALQLSTLAEILLKQV